MSSFRHPRVGRRSNRKNVKRTPRFHSRSLGYEHLEGRDLLAVITVTSADDNLTFDTKVTLREAIAAANTDTSVDGSTAGSGADTIVFDSTVAGDTILLSLIGDNSFSLSSLRINSTITINADATSGITIGLEDNATDMRLFYVAANGNLTLRNATLTDGRAYGNAGNFPGGGGGAGLGGAFAVDSGNLTIENCLFVGNTALGGSGAVGQVATGNVPANSENGGYGAGGGGGGFNFFVGNGVDGGNGGFAGGGGGGGGSKFGVPGDGGFGGFGGGNGGDGSTTNIGAGGGGGGLGGAIFNEGGVIRLTNTTFSANQAIGGSGGDNGAEDGLGLGGAIFNHNGSVTIRNVTINDNVAAEGGGGIYNLGDGTTASLSLVSTIVSNTRNGANDIVGNAIFGGNNNTAGDRNIIERQSGFSGTSTITSDPKLDDLDDNGGPTFTHALLPNSPALNAGQNTSAPTIDQRRFTRPVNGTVDIGAYENQNPQLTVDNNSVSVAQGATASNSGSFDDLDLNDDVTVSANVGTISPATSGNSGTWNWSLSTAGGSVNDQTVTITANDGRGGISTITFSLIVGNAAPSVTLSGATTANEGQTRHYTFTAANGGSGTYSIESTSGGSFGTVSNATVNANTGAGSFDVTFSDGPETSTVGIQLRNSSGGLTNVSEIDVTIANVAPVVTLRGPASAGNGQKKHYDFTTSDPGVDTFSIVATSGGSVGTVSNLVFDSDTGAGGFDVTFGTGPATSNVSVRLQDSDGANSNLSTIAVTVGGTGNQAPSITADNASVAVNEGSNVTNTGSFGDLDFNDHVTITANIGSISTSSVGSNGTWNWSFQSTDGPDESQTVTITATDTSQATATVTFTLTVDNVAPVVTLSGPAGASSGQTKHYTFTTVDPGDDTFTLIATSGGTFGTVSNISFDTATGNGSFDVTFGNGPANSSVSVQVRDSDMTLSNISTVNVAISASSSDFPWHNDNKPLDVNNDGIIAPIDALLIVNELNRPRWSGANGALPVPPPPGEIPFLDVNRDNFVSPIDALGVINHINTFGSGEGEAPQLAETPKSAPASTSAQNNYLSAVDQLFQSDDWIDEISSSDANRFKFE